MAFEPKDPNELFSILGPDRVAAAIVSGELTGDLKAKAEVWFSLDHMLASRTTSRKTMELTWWQVALGVVGALGAVGTIVGLVLAAIQHAS